MRNTLATIYLFFSHKYFTLRVTFPVLSCKGIGWVGETDSVRGGQPEPDSVATMVRWFHAAALLRREVLKGPCRGLMRNWNPWQVHKQIFQQKGPSQLTSTLTIQFTQNRRIIHPFIPMATMQHLGDKMYIVPYWVQLPEIKAYELRKTSCAGNKPVNFARRRRVTWCDYAC